MIRCQGLTKRYGDFAALADCTLDVPRGEIFGLLGPNGAGKTTLIRTLLGFIGRSEGVCRVDGLDPATDSLAVRRRVAYLPGDARLPRHMRGGAVLKFFAKLHSAGDLDRSMAVADVLELDLARHVAFMSTGMRQKLALAVVFGPKTPLLILDEPTANLDPSVRAGVLDLIRREHAGGRTVMFSSHVLSEIEETCASVAFLRRGRLAKELRLSDLNQRHRIVGQIGRGELVEIPPPLSDLVEVQSRRGNQLTLVTQGDLADVLPWITSLPLSAVRIEPFGLAAVYRQVHLGDNVGHTDQRELLPHQQLAHGEAGSETP